MDETFIPIAAAFLVTGKEKTAPGNVDVHPLPVHIKQILNKESKSLLKWWDTIPSAKARKRFPQVSKAKYRRFEIAAEGKRLNRLLTDGKLFAYFVIEPNPLEGSDGFKYVSINILLTGKPPKMREILKWLNAPVGSFPKKSG